MPSFETENLKHVNGIASKILLLISMLICHFCYRTITALWYKAELKTRNIEWTRRWASYKVIQDLFLQKNIFERLYKIYKKWMIHGSDLQRVRYSDFCSTFLPTFSSLAWFVCWPFQTPCAIVLAISSLQYGAVNKYIL